ncbi:hypothetical protein C265_23785 [Cupriavidus sp. GA3-3]|nr:hypothetical protein C265_23785 [Cupriavidus sp. GA3-3]
MTFVMSVLAPGFFARYIEYQEITLGVERDVSRKFPNGEITSHIINALETMKCHPAYADMCSSV